MLISILHEGLAEIDSRRRTRSDVAGSAGRKTPISKISSDELKPQYLPLKPMVSTDAEGSPSFYTPGGGSSPNLTFRPSQSPISKRASRRSSPSDKKGLESQTNTTSKGEEKERRLSPVDDERDMIMELVRDIAMDLDVTSVSHRILQVHIPKIICSIIFS